MNAKVFECWLCTAAETNNVLPWNAYAYEVLKKLIEGMVRVAHHEDCLTGVHAQRLGE
ncbi:hypothetical protein PISMIDRAFT_676156 [Pisolithus microcarpus 441]|uniref:Uncharacterized protein n=1 Tax=Pisolithus microcarpus 441 TaxID=765257 RepID=A0A0C9ZVT6_9AGAM|nr:hypothetical protein PISMIDRAFT_676156 [Pisolithus microcarpus 441]